MRRAFTHPARRVAGIVEGAHAMWNQEPPNNTGRTVAQKAGLRFERRVLSALTAGHPNFIPHLPFIFLNEGRRRAAIPDGICFSRSLDIITIVEIKSRHTEEAWQQLNLLYLPVVSRAFPGKLIKLLEICRAYEPGILLPGKTAIISDAFDFFDNEEFLYSVLPWRDT